MSFRSSERIRKRKAPSQLCVGACYDDVLSIPAPSFDFDAVPTYNEESVRVVKGRPAPKIRYGPMHTSSGKCLDESSYNLKVGLFEPGYYKIENPAGPPVNTLKHERNWNKKRRRKWYGEVTHNFDFRHCKEEDLSYGCKSFGLSVELGHNDNVILYNHNMNHSNAHIELTRKEFHRLLKVFKEQHDTATSKYNYIRHKDDDIHEAFDEAAAYLKETEHYTQFVVDVDNVHYLAWYLKDKGLFKTMPRELVKKLRSVCQCQPEDYEPIILESGKLLTVQYFDNHEPYFWWINSSSKWHRRGDPERIMDNSGVWITPEEAYALCGITAHWPYWIDYHLAHPPTGLATCATMASSME